MRSVLLPANEGEQGYSQFLIILNFSFFSRRPTEKALYMSPDGQGDADNTNVRTRCVFIRVLVIFFGAHAILFKQAARCQDKAFHLRR